MQAAIRQFVGECGSLEREPLPLLEITVRPIRGEAPVDAELLRSVDLLNSLGMPVVVTRLIESYRLIEYVRRYTKEPLRFAGAHPPSSRSFRPTMLRGSAVCSSAGAVAGGERAASNVLPDAGGYFPPCAWRMWDWMPNYFPPAATVQ